MVTKEQFINGILVYAEKEVIPALPTIGKWGIGAGIILAKNQADTIITNLANNNIVKTLGVVNDSGEIDVERLAYALKQSAEQYGNVQINVPVVGTLTFTSSDIEKLKHYIVRGA